MLFPIFQKSREKTSKLIFKRSYQNKSLCGFQINYPLDITKFEKEILLFMPHNSAFYVCIQKKFKYHAILSFIFTCF